MRFGPQPTSYLESIGGRLWNKTNDPASIGIIPSPGNTNFARGMSLITPGAMPYFAACRAIKTNKPGKPHFISFVFILDAVSITAGNNFTMDHLNSGFQVIPGGSLQQVQVASTAGTYIRWLYNGMIIAPADGIIIPQVTGGIDSSPNSLNYNYQYSILAWP